MMMCWQEDPNERPAFADLRNKLKQMENQHKVRLLVYEYISFDHGVYANSNVTIKSQIFTMFDFIRDLPKQEKEDLRSVDKNVNLRWL